MKQTFIILCFLIPFVANGQENVFLNKNEMVYYKAYEVRDYAIDQSMNSDWNETEEMIIFDYKNKKLKFPEQDYEVQIQSHVKSKELENATVLEMYDGIDNFGNNVAVTYLIKNNKDETEKEIIIALEGKEGYWYRIEEV